LGLGENRSLLFVLGLMVACAHLINYTSSSSSSSSLLCPLSSPGTLTPSFHQHTHAGTSLSNINERTCTTYLPASIANSSLHSPRQLPPPPCSIKQPPWTLEKENTGDSATVHNSILVENEARCRPPRLDNDTSHRPSSRLASFDEKLFSHTRQHPLCARPPPPPPPPTR